MKNKHTFVKFQEQMKYFNIYLTAVTPRQTEQRQGFPFFVVSW